MCLNNYTSLEVADKVKIVNSKKAGDGLTRKLPSVEDRQKLKS